MTITAETRFLIQAALEGDPALASLAVTGSAPDTLSAKIAPGVPVNAIGGSTYAPEPPFRREVLVELVVRLQRLRWQRVNMVTQWPEPPEEHDLQALHEKHRRATVAFDCWAGWTNLLDAVFAWLHEIAPDNQWLPDQIKEKYGTLRFYWHGDLPDPGDQIIEAAEHISGQLCEVCGAPGILQSQHGWWNTRCPDHKRWTPP